MTDTTENFPEAENFPAEEQTGTGAAQATPGDTTITIDIAPEQKEPEVAQTAAETVISIVSEHDADSAGAGQPEAGAEASAPVGQPDAEDEETVERRERVRRMSAAIGNSIEAGQVLLEAKGLVKAYHGRRVVNNVNLTVKSGEIVGLLGPNGAGKTTSFYMVTGLIKPNEGEVFFKGVDVSQFPMYVRARMGMGYLAQEPSIFRKLSVEDNILAILQTLDISSAERKTRLEALLNGLELDHLRKQKAMTLSGGERRRLEITRALVTNPSFIMLDEPFSGVDPIVVYQIQQIIRALRDMGLGILITDHNVRETLSCVDRAYLMADGRVCLEGTSDFLINSEEARKIYLGPAFVL